MIRKLPGRRAYRVTSHNGRNLGTFTTREAAEKRLRQVEFFRRKNQ